MAAAVSGASSIAASDPKSVMYQALTNASAIETTCSGTFVFTGLTAGTNTFTAQYKFTAVGGGTQINSAVRSITVKGIA
jgi:hypothetical protein